MKRAPTSFRLTKAEHELVLSAAIARGMSISEFVRLSVLERIESPQAHDQAAIAFKHFAEKAGELLDEVSAQFTEERQAELEELRDEHRRSREEIQQDLKKFYRAMEELLTELLPGSSTGGR